MSEIWDAQEEASRLEARFKEVNQAEFARAHGVPGGPSMLNQQLKGRRPLNMDSAIAIAQGLNVPLREISPRLAIVLEGAIQKGLVGGPKVDLQLQQIKILLDLVPAGARDAAFLQATESLMKFLIAK